MRARSSSAVFCLLLAWSSCADLDAPFTCSTDSECTSKEGAGICQPSTHACSFPDATCSSGQRYGGLDGKGLAGVCTDALDLGVGDLGAGDLATDTPSVQNVAHLAGLQHGGTGALTFSVDDDMGTSSSIDTTALQINGRAPPSGVVFEHGQEATSGAELAILRVGTLVIPSSVTVRVTGGDGLVIVASGDVVVSGVIDASAHGNIPGPGGFGSGAGLGAGSSGTYPKGSSGAGYGAGGGVGNQGGSGGVQASTPPLAGGVTYGDASITVLLGGSGGGMGSHDASGAGGGSVQISSATSVSINAPGGVNAGGGGMLALPPSRAAYTASAGGSGGSIFLQAPTVKLSGTLAANGGGGGASTYSTSAQDGRLSQVPAMGGVGEYNQGGAGGARGAAAGEGTFGYGDQEGGAGGGAVGRIAILYHLAYDNFGTTSPAESVTKD